MQEEANRPVVGVRGQLLRVGFVFLLMVATGEGPFLAWIEISLDGLRERLVDLVRPVPRQPEVVLVEVDDQDLVETPSRWPWNRRLFARALDRLGQAGAAGVVLAADLGLDASSVDDAEQDPVLVAALSKHLAVWLDATASRPLEVFSRATRGAYPEGLETAPGGIAKTFVPDRDGRPTLFGAVLGSERTLSGPVQVDLRAGREAEIHSFRSLLADPPPDPDLFRGKLVVLGASATLVHDRVLTRGGKLVPRARLLASTLAAVGAGSAIRPVPPIPVESMLLALLLPLALASRGPGDRPVAILRRASILGGAWWATAATLLLGAGFSLPLVRPSLALGFLALLRVLRARRRALQGAFLVEVEVEADAESRFHKALELLEMGDQDGAVACLEQVASAPSSFRTASLGRLLLCRLARGEVAEARAVVAKLPASGVPVEDLYAAGVEFERAGEKEIAKRLFEEVQRADLDFRDVSERIAELRHDLAGLGEQEIIEVVVRRILDRRFHEVKVMHRGASILLSATEPRAGKRRVAIKVLSPLEANQEVAHARFLREARLLQRLSHPNLVGVLDVFPESIPYYSMELLEGRSLAEEVAARGHLPPREAAGMVEAAARGLAVAHEAGLVHRDVKPANLFVLPGGRIVVLDFGTAHAAGDSRLTLTGQILGTPVYMSPEQVRGEVVDPRTDVYALGLVLYELIAGEPPFRTMTERLLRPSPKLPEVLSGHPALAALLARCLSPRRDQRFADAGKLAEALAQAQQPGTQREGTP